MEKKFRQVQCYLCKEKILVESDKVKLDIGVSKKNMKNFHKECSKKYKEHREEWNKWCNVYDYVKRNILFYKKEQSLSPHQRTKLQALRDGSFIIKRGEQLRREGYSHEVILMTFMIKKKDILIGLEGKVFTNEDQKFNYIMSIVGNSINDVYLKLDKAKKNEGKLTEKISADIDEPKTEVKFKNINKINKNKVANKLKHLI